MEFIKFLIIFHFTYIQLFANCNETSLILVQTIFRHGDRTPTITKLFKDNPINDTNFWPYGRGQLTLKGKKRSYELGTRLKDRYKDFINLFHVNYVKAFSSEMDRTIMSLQSVLTGLFPPSQNGRLNEDLLWQPVPLRIIPSDRDRMLYINCKKIFHVNAKFDNKTLSYIKELEKHNGMKFTNALSFLQFKTNIDILSEMGYEIPDWICPFWPETLHKISLTIFNAIGQQKLSVISAHFLETLTENFLKKINGHLLPEDLKMILYSGHDISVFGLLVSLGIYHGELVRYSESVILELHRINGEFGVKVFNDRADGFGPQLKRIKGCDLFCPIESFEKLTKEKYPKDPWCY